MTIAVTPGEPAGIGPDLVVAAAQAPRAVDWVAVADAAMLERRAGRLGLPLVIEHFAGQATRRAGHLSVVNVPAPVAAEPGRLDARNAPYVLATLEAAAAGCLDGTFAAWVTGPVQKSVIADAGIAFSGHTEWLAERLGVDRAVMLLVAGTLRVALATTHVPLRAVPDLITRAHLAAVLEVLLGDLSRRFGLARPRVKVAGLNPHAGEGGHLGREDGDVIAPVVAELAAAGHRVSGPYPADTLFTPGQLEGCDAVLAMYHDQGLPVLKHVGFSRAVNVTLGLPIVRTSVDHGTALDIAGTGAADGGSFAAALDLAGELAGARP